MKYSGLNENWYNGLFNDSESNFASSNSEYLPKIFAVNSLKFTCDMDGNSSTKTYPRTTDPVYNKNIPIKSHSSPNITVDVGKVNQFSVHVGVSTAGGLVGPLQMELICSILENSTAQ